MTVQPAAPAGAAPGPAATPPAPGAQAAPSAPTAPAPLAVRRRGLTIAMVGQKGLPATIGGIEHHVEQVGARLAERGHDVVVYSRDTYGDIPADGRYRGMRVVAAPTIGTKHLDAIVHSGSSTLKAMAAKADIVHFHALGPGLVAPLPRFLSGSRVVLTVHGLDNARDKWGKAAQAVLGTAHWMSGHVPDATVVVSRELQAHYARTFHREAAYITNGVPTPERVDAPEVPRRFGLEPGRYLMFVGRLVPEKRPDLLVRAFRESAYDGQLAVVGVSSFTDGFTAQLRELAADDERIVFTGFVGGRDLAALFQHARLLVQPSDLEGLPLTLLESVAHGCHVLASDIAPHREVLGRGTPAHRLFPAGDLDALRAGIEAPVDGDAWDVPEREAILQHYSWDRATEQLEQLYLELLARPRGLRRLGRANGTP
ncbi:glycosyltransferase family 4 protein [Lapillicoccus jejuensis]|uniref:D-inositol 3-phosphate glycosyltransferase n=1 Tax=Lapillicoccus jejuensis TaxID=402171 RepID=A0A542E1F6_9MICO|nr:glycosyltransferase family 4 protein [Lapillicoccus jejuensis]TQJ09181.1 glycosyltransferase involved in cell wall biosynthesis [Lapillicoccus jejuensis]